MGNPCPGKLSLCDLQARLFLVTSVQFCEESCIAWTVRCGVVDIVTKVEQTQPTNRAASASTAAK